MILATLTYLTEPRTRRIRVPVACLLLDDDGTFYHRIPRDGEWPREVDGAEVLPHLCAHLRKIEKWCAKQSLPHSQGLVFTGPHSDQWWEHVRKLLHHSVGLDETCLICPGLDPARELETGFQERVLGVVAP
jgi:hypothetical protein